MSYFRRGKVPKLDEDSQVFMMSFTFRQIKRRLHVFIDFPVIFIDDCQQ